MEVHVPTLPEKLDLPEQYQVPYPEQYFKLPTLMAAVGPRGKGKTYSLSLWNQWMFDNLYFTRFYAIDPTYESNDCVKVVPLRPDDLYTDVNRSREALAEIVYKIMEEAAFYKEMTEVYPEKYAEYEEKNHNVSKMNQDTVRYLREKMRILNSYYDHLEELQEQMEVKSKVIEYILQHREKSPYLQIEMIIGSQFDELHPWFPRPPKLVRPCPLLFLDDLSHTELYSPSRSNPLNNLTLRHRHLGGQGYGVSIQFAVQTFKTGVTKALRENTQQFLLFDTRDQSVIESMYEGVGSHCTEEEFMKLYRHATADPHGFLLVDNSTNDKDRLFRKGWDTFLVGFVSDDHRKLSVKKLMKMPTKQIKNLDETSFCNSSKKVTEGESKSEEKETEANEPKVKKRKKDKKE